MSYGSEENIRSRYEAMTDNRLRDYARQSEELTELGKELLRQEFERRGIAMDSAKTPAPGSPGAEAGYAPEPEAYEKSATDISPEYEDKLLRMVTIRSYRDLSEAVVARAVLENEDIYCFLRDENTVRMDWMWSNMIGGIRLQVAEDDAEKANEILAQPIPESFELEDGQIFDQPICPKCGSLNVGAKNVDPSVGLATAATFAISVPLSLPAIAIKRDDVLLCNTCGCLWRDDEEYNAEL